MMKKLIFMGLTSVLASQVFAYSINFKSPSGNILCGGEQNSVSCFVTEKTGKPPMPRPKNCEFDWGQKFNLKGNGKATMACYSDFEYDTQAPVLQYGQTVSGKSWQCTSTQNGMRCENNSRRGFQLNRQQQILF